MKFRMSPVLATIATIAVGGPLLTYYGLAVAEAEDSSGGDLIILPPGVVEQIEELGVGDLLVLHATDADGNVSTLVPEDTRVEPIDLYVDGVDFSKLSLESINFGGVAASEVTPGNTEINQETPTAIDNTRVILTFESNPNNKCEWPPSNGDRCRRFSQ